MLFKALSKLTRWVGVDFVSSATARAATRRWPGRRTVYGARAGSCIGNAWRLEGGVRRISSRLSRAVSLCASLSRRM